MNFDNKSEGEDRQLLQLLKEEMKEFPSDQLVEKTMSKISAMQAEKKYAYKPLRVPIYIMLTIGLFLPIPFLIPMPSDSLLLNSLSELLAYPETSFLKYAIWGWLSGVVLWIFGVLFKSHSRFYLNPFKL